MSRARKCRIRPVAKSLPQSIREFLTSAVFRQVRNAVSRRKQPRWDLHPLLYVLLLTTWCCGDSLPEQFEVASERTESHMEKLRDQSETLSEELRAIQEEKVVLQQERGVLGAG